MWNDKESYLPLTYLASGKMRPNNRHTEQKRFVIFVKYLQEKKCCYQEEKKRETLAKKTSKRCCVMKNTSSQEHSLAVC
jgi:hypothetical protein